MEFQLKTDHLVSESNGADLALATTSCNSGKTSSRFKGKCVRLSDLAEGKILGKGNMKSINTTSICFGRF